MLDLNLLNIQPTELLQHAQLIWVPEKDNLFLVNFPISLKKVKIKKHLKILLSNLAFKQEVWVDNIHQWILKEPLIFHQVQDSELNNHM